MNYTVMAEGIAEDEKTTGGNPKPKTPEEMTEDPKEKVNPEVVKDMAADAEITKHSESIHKLDMSPEQAKGLWESVTKGATHKHTACVNAMKGKVKDPHAFCMSLGEKNGYKPQEQ